MIHARADYNAIQPWPTKRPHIAKDADGDTLMEWPSEETDARPIIPDDEPVFLVRAQDKAAPGVVRAWANANDLLGGDAQLSDAARAHSYLMEAWQERVASKVADAPEGVL